MQFGKIAAPELILVCVAFGYDLWDGHVCVVGRFTRVGKPALNVFGCFTLCTCVSCSCRTCWENISQKRTGEHAAAVAKIRKNKLTDTFVRVPVNAGMRLQLLDLGSGPEIGYDLYLELMVRKLPAVGHLQSMISFLPQKQQTDSMASKLARLDLFVDWRGAVGEANASATGLHGGSDAAQCTGVLINEAWHVAKVSVRFDETKKSQVHVNIAKTHRPPRKEEQETEADAASSAFPVGPKAPSSGGLFGFGSTSAPQFSFGAQQSPAKAAATGPTKVNEPKPSAAESKTTEATVKEENEEPVCDVAPMYRSVRDILGFQVSAITYPLRLVLEFFKVWWIVDTPTIDHPRALHAHSLCQHAKEF